MQPVEQARLAISRDAIPWVRRHGASRVFLASDCDGRRCAEPGRYGPRDNAHPQPEVACFLTGDTRFWLGDQLMTFQSGDFLIMPSGLPHYPDVRGLRVVSALRAQPLPTSLWVTAYPLGGSMLLMQMAGDLYEVSRSVFLMDPELLASVQRLVTELQTRQSGYDVMVESALLALLGTALRCPIVPAPAPETSPEPAQAAPETDGLVAAAKQFIHTRYAELVSLPVLANALFVSESHLSRQFKRETGQTVVQYLTQVRVAAARELLQTDLPIYGVASLAGFRDPLYFSQVFHRLVGETPTAYREALFTDGKAHCDPG